MALVLVHVQSAVSGSSLGQCYAGTLSELKSWVSQQLEVPATWLASFACLGIHDLQKSPHEEIRGWLRAPSLKGVVARLTVLT